MSTAPSLVAPKPRGGLAPWLAALAGLALVAVFALEGPATLPGIVAVGLAMALCAIAAPRSLRPWFLPVAFATVVFGQVARGVFLYEVGVVVVALLALVLQLRHNTRAGWQLDWPGWFAVAWVILPLLAVPGHIASLESFLGDYKLYVGWAVAFLALRRLLHRENSHVLLWIFPLIGVAGSIQLGLKTAWLGDLLLSRPTLRNFYTQLPWGWSDFVSAVMEVVVCACVLLFVLDRRPWARLIVVGSGLFAFASYLVLLSRGGAIGLLGFALVLVIGLGGRRGLLAASSAGLVFAAALLTRGGQALLGRFTDPRETASVLMRFVLWTTSWNRFRISPLTGVGLNQARYQHDFIGAGWGGNLVLDRMAEEGILGGVLVVAIVFALFRLAARAEPAGVSGSPRAVRLAAIGLLGEWVFHAAVEPTFTGPALVVPMLFFAAWLTLQDPHARIDAGARPR